MLHLTRRPAILLAALCFALAGCGKDKKAGPVAPPKPPDTYESLTAELIDLNTAFGDTLASVTNAEDAKIAVPQLEKIGVEFENLAIRMEKLGLPQGEVRKITDAMISESKIELKKKATRLSAVMLSKAEIGEVLHDGVDGLHKRLDQFVILERWADTNREQ